MRMINEKEQIWEPQGEKWKAAGFSDNVNPYIGTHKMEASPVTQPTTLKSKPKPDHTSWKPFVVKEI